MQLMLEPSLQCSSLTAIAATLWGSNDIQSSSPALLLTERSNCRIWYDTLHMVEAKANALVLPQLIKTKLLQYVQVVGWEILRWFRSHRFYYTTDEVIPKRFFFTYHGTVDLVETAVALMEDDTLDPIYRFKLACVYCQYKYIISMWRKLDHGTRTMLHNLPFSLNCNSLVSFWSLHLREQLHFAYHSFTNESLKHPYPFGFYISVMSGNMAGTRFFYEKLTEREREEVVMVSLNGLLSREIDTYFTGKYAKVVSFLMNPMDEEQQNELLYKFPAKILKLFLDWPWQEHFMELNKKIGCLVPSYSFYELLNEILYKRRKGYGDFDYQQMFIKMWEQSTDTQKSYICNRYNRMWYMLCELHKLGDWKTYNMLSKYATADFRKEFLFCPRVVYQICIKESYAPLEEFITECFMSKEEILELRSKISAICCPATAVPKKNELLQFIDGLALRFKRKYTEGDGNECKKRRLSEP